MADNSGAHSTNPAFFASQYQNLNSLLARVVHDSATASAPDVCMHYLQLTELLSALLEECQLYGICGIGALQRRETDVRTFLSKLETLESVVSDWGSRPEALPTSRKRGRTVSSTNEASHASRRRLETETEQALNMAPVFDAPFAEMIPLDAYEERDSPWWAEPYYD